MVYLWLCSYGIVATCIEKCVVHSLNPHTYLLLFFFFLSRPFSQELHFLLHMCSDPFLYYFSSEMRRTLEPKYRFIHLFWCFPFGFAFVSYCIHSSFVFFFFFSFLSFLVFKYPIKWFLCRIKMHWTHHPIQKRRARERDW